MLKYLLFGKSFTFTFLQRSVKELDRILCIVFDETNEATMDPQYDVQDFKNLIFKFIELKKRLLLNLAKIAIYFLEETQRNALNDMTPRRYEDELNALHKIIQKTVSSLFADSKAIVKEMLLESGICDLCAFFGQEKANDIILPHITTILNTDDKSLRGAFYDYIAGVAGYVGWPASDILVPMVQKGFTDREEFVIAKAIRAASILIQIGHIKKHTITNMIRDSACYLCHPNIWVRHEICGMISIAARTLSAIDVQCTIMPSIEKYLKAPLIQVEKADILLDCLLPPIPRQIYDSVLRYQDVNKIIKALEERAIVRKMTRPDALPQYSESSQSLRNLFRRLNSEGLNDTIECQLLAMKSHLFELKHKSQQDNDEKISANGRIIVHRQHIACHEYPLADKTALKSPLENRMSDPAITTPVSEALQILPHSTANSSAGSSNVCKTAALAKIQP